MIRFSKQVGTSARDRVGVRSRVRVGLSHRPLVFCTKKNTHTHKNAKNSRKKKSINRTKYIW